MKLLSVLPVLPVPDPVLFRPLGVGGGGGGEAVISTASLTSARPGVVPTGGSGRGHARAVSCLVAVTDVNGRGKFHQLSVEHRHHDVGFDEVPHLEEEGQLVGCFPPNVFLRRGCENLNTYKHAQVH